jgi:hypothetical protein
MQRIKIKRVVKGRGAQMIAASYIRQDTSLPEYLDIMKMRDPGQEVFDK